jgi:hypothetical protein
MIMFWFDVKRGRKATTTLRSGQRAPSAIVRLTIPLGGANGGVLGIRQRIAGFATAFGGKPGK